MIREEMMKKGSIAKAITATVLFCGIFCFLMRYGVYAVAVVAVFITAHILR